MEFTIENLERAVSHFYQDLATQSQLNLWLTAAQSSAEAWTFSWQLLDQTKPLEIQYFGASSLQTKLSRFWHEVPVNNFVILREKLIKTVISYSNGPKLVLTRLCLALSSMILHSIPEQWTSPLSDLISILQQASGSDQMQPQFVTLLLEVLTVLPEEFQAMKFSQERRLAIRGELLKAVKEVLPILREVISRGRHDLTITPGAESAAQSGIKCLSSWIQNGVGVSLEESVHLVEPLLTVSRNACLSESALDALTHLINHPEAHRYPNLLLGMLSQLLTLQDYLQALHRDGDVDGAAHVYALYAAFGESHSRLLLNAVLEEGPNKENVLLLVKLLLDSTGTAGRYPLDENCSHLAFSFWYILQDDMCSSAPEKLKIYESLFGPAYLTLVDILMTKSMISVDQSDWSPDEKETFRCYRQDIADTLAYCYKFLRCSMMERLAAHLTSTINQCNQNPNEWPPLEACLHALKAVAENVESEADQLVPQILGLFGSIPFGSGHRHVVNTALETLGSYAEWLSAHPTYLGHVLPILLFGLTNPEAAPAATLALKDITRDCQIGIRPYADSLLQGVEQAIRLEELKAHEKIRLMYILGKVLSVLSLDVIIASLNRVVGPCVEDLRSLCATPDPDAFTKARLITCLKMIATLCTTLDLRVSSGEDSEVDDAASRQALAVQQQPVKLIAQQLMPFLKGIVDRWGADEQISESICLVIKHTISTLMEESVIFLPDLAAVIVQCHRLSPQTATLDVAKMITMMFSQAIGEAEQLVQAFLCEIIGTTLQVCGVNSSSVSGEGIPSVDVSRLAENNEVLTSFLSLLTQILRKCPKLLTRASYPVSALFYCGIIGLSRPESPAMKASTQYLVHFITQSRETPELVSVVQTQGQLLVSQLLSCIGGESPRALVEHTADVILALNKKYFDSLCRWLNTSLAQENFPSALVNPQQKENFCRFILKERSNKRRLQELVREFSLQCRGLSGTEYSDQTNRVLP